MNTVINNENTLIIKNSKFICIIYPINNIDDVNNYLNDVKKTYKDATHYCYGFIFDNIKKESGDGEPSKTAGVPIMLVLEKNKLNRVLCIVIRYFGGIKLGAGGLVRAYTKSVTECLKGHIKNLSLGYNITITFKYNNINQIDYLLKDCIILNKKYDSDIYYNANVTKDVLDKIKNISEVSIVINNETYI